MKVLPARRPLGWKPPRNCEQRLHDHLEEACLRFYLTPLTFTIFLDIDFYQKLRLEMKEYVVQFNAPWPSEQSFCGFPVKVKRMSHEFLVMSNEGKP